MRTFSLKNFFSICICLLIGNLAFSQSKNIKIIFTSETNGHPLAFSHMNDNGQGGIPARATLIKDIAGNRHKNNVLLLDTGSVFGGRPESNVMNGMPDIVGMNRLKYDCAAIGITELQRTYKEFEALNQKCEFTYLGANISFMNKIMKRTELVSDDFFIKKVGGIKVGIFSVITEDAKYLIKQKYQSEYIIGDPIKVANSMVSKLKREKQCDVIIALTHLGYYKDDESAIDVKALANNTKNIDLIIDGRNDDDFSEAVVINEIPICKVGKWGLSVGEVNLQIQNGKVVGYNFKNHPVNHKINGEYVGDKKLDEDIIVRNAIKASLASYDFAVSAKITEPNPDFDFDISTIRYEECDFGNLLADSVLAHTRAEISLQSTGGIDNTATIDGTKITRKIFDNVVVYDNPIVVIGLTGREIQEVLEYSVSRKGYGGFLQIAGITFEYDSNGNVHNIQMKSQPIDFNRKYDVAITRWMYMGGDGYSMLKKYPIKSESVFTTREILYDYVEDMEQLTIPFRGRIKQSN